MHEKELFLPMMFEINIIAKCKYNELHMKLQLIYLKIFIPYFSNNLRSQIVLITILIKPENTSLS